MALPAPTAQPCRASTKETAARYCAALPSQVRCTLQVAPPFGGGEDGPVAHRPAVGGVDEVDRVEALWWSPSSARSRWRRRPWWPGWCRRRPPPSRGWRRRSRRRRAARRSPSSARTSRHRRGRGGGGGGQPQGERDQDEREGQEPEDSPPSRAARSLRVRTASCGTPRDGVTPGVTPLSEPGRAPSRRRCGAPSTDRSATRAHARLGQGSCSCLPYPVGQRLGCWRNRGAGEATHGYGLQPLPASS